MPNPTEQVDAVEEARELLAKATPRPWEAPRLWDDSGLVDNVVYHAPQAGERWKADTPTICVLPHSQQPNRANAELIARAPELLKTLADEVRRLRKIEARNRIGTLIVSPEIDALCATVRVLREDLKQRCEALEELRRCRDRWLTMLNPATAGMSVDDAITALREQLAQVTQERDALQEQLKAAFRELLNEQDSNRNFRKAAVALCKRSASNWRTTGGRSQGDYARACREKANLITEIATALEQLQCKTESNHEPQR